MIIVLANDKVSVYGIPPLSPHPPDFLNNNLTHISPLLKTSLPNDITCNYTRIMWERILDWYASSSQSIHLGVSVFSTAALDNNIHNIEIVIKPDLSDISLHVSNTAQIAGDYFGSILCEDYHIFEDHTHVSEVFIVGDESWIFIRSMSPSPNIILPASPIIVTLSLPSLRALLLSSSCLASGRIVYVPIPCLRGSWPWNNFHELEIVVVDFLDM
jgi:hypothetical protein